MPSCHADCGRLRLHHESHTSYAFTTSVPRDTLVVSYSPSVLQLTDDSPPSLPRCRNSLMTRHDVVDDDAASRRLAHGHMDGEILMAMASAIWP